MKNTKITNREKNDVVSAYFNERSRRNKYKAKEFKSYSYNYISSWSDTHHGLSAAELALMLEWN